jgi:hypothetical protein
MVVEQEGAGRAVPGFVFLLPFPAERSARREERLQREKKNCGWPAALQHEIQETAEERLFESRDRGGSKHWRISTVLGRAFDML